MSSTITDEALQAVVFDYLEGYWTGDEERVTRALHPELAKRVRSAADGSIGFRAAGDLIGKAADGSAKLETVPQIDVVVLDTYTNSASLRIETPTFVEWAHVVATDDGWQILNLACDLKPKD